MDETQRQKLRDAGFSDQDIADYETEHGGNTVTATASGPAAADETIPSIAQANPNFHEHQITDYIPAVAGGATGAMDALKSIVPVAGSAITAASAWGARNAFKDYLKQKAMMEAQQAAASAPIGTPNSASGVKIPINQPINPGTAVSRAPITNSIPTNVPPAVGGPAAQQGANFLENMAQKFGGLAQRVAPVLNNPLVQGVAKIGGVGGQMATYHPSLNTGEAEELRRRQARQFQPYSR
jgi:hypothetical protein